MTSFFQSDQVNPAIQTRSGPANELLSPQKMKKKKHRHGPRAFGVVRKAE
jgi:hypothetical protein